MVTAMGGDLSLLIKNNQFMQLNQRGLTEPKKRVFLKCGLSMGAMTGKLQNLHNINMNPCSVHRCKNLELANFGACA